MVIGVVLMTVFNQFNARQAPANTMEYSQFLEEAKAGKITRATIDGRVLQLIDQRRDKRGLATAREAGDRQPDVAIPSPVHHLKGLVLQHRP